MEAVTMNGEDASIKSISKSLKTLKEKLHKKSQKTSTVHTTTESEPNSSNLVFVTDGLVESFSSPSNNLASQKINKSIKSESIDDSDEEEQIHKKVKSEPIQTKSEYFTETDNYVAVIKSEPIDEALVDQSIDSPELDFDATQIKIESIEHIKKEETPDNNTDQGQFGFIEADDDDSRLLRPAEMVPVNYASTSHNLHTVFNNVEVPRHFLDPTPISALGTKAKRRVLLPRPSTAAVTMLEPNLGRQHRRILSISDLKKETAKKKPETTKSKVMYPFHCDRCDYRSKTKALLTVHIGNHTGQRPFPCNMCDYRSTSKGNLIKHIRTHTGEKPLECGVCGYRTAFKGHLIIHMRKHTGERPFSCESCTYTCARKSTLLDHQRTHTGERPFNCQVCTYTSTTRSNLRSHIRKHHGPEYL